MFTSITHDSLTPIATSSMHKLALEGTILDVLVSEMKEPPNRKVIAPCPRPADGYGSLSPSKLQSHIRLLKLQQYTAKARILATEPEFNRIALEIEDTLAKAFALEDEGVLATSMVSDLVTRYQGVYDRWLEAMDKEKEAEREITEMIEEIEYILKERIRNPPRRTLKVSFTFTF